MNEENPREEKQVGVEDDITEITSAEMEMALRNMKNGKATGPDNLPAEVWKSLGRTGVNFLKEALNKITDEEKIPDIWRKSILIPIYIHVNPPSFVRRLRHFGIAENLRPGDENLRHLTVTTI